MTAPAPPAAPVPAAPAAVRSAADVIARVLPGVVNVRTVGFDGAKGDASGVVIDRRGVILTNNHVVEGARTVTVTFNDGRHDGVVRAEVVGTAPERDLAIIHVGLNDLVPVPLGRSSRAPARRRRARDRLPARVRRADRDARHRLRARPHDHARTPARRSRACSRRTPRSTPETRAAPSSTSRASSSASTPPRREGRTAQSVGFSIAIDQARGVIEEIRNKPAAQRSWIGARSTRSTRPPRPCSSASRRRLAAPSSSPSTPAARPRVQACARATSSSRSTARRCLERRLLEAPAVAEPRRLADDGRSSTGPARGGRASRSSSGRRRCPAARPGAAGSPVTSPARASCYGTMLWFWLKTLSGS